MTSWVVVVHPLGGAAGVSAVHGLWRSMDAAEEFASAVDASDPNVVAQVVRLGGKLRRDIGES